MLLGLKVTANQRQKMRLDNVVWVWNFGLSIFSLAGAAYCVPRLLFGTEAGLLTAGFYPAVCAPALSYGFGMSGFFTALFIYSKFFELLDTTWLLLRKHDVIVLHWYHHFTVLLYCWHSYSVRTGTRLSLPCRPLLTTSLCLRLATSGTDRHGPLVRCDELLGTHGHVLLLRLERVQAHGT